MSKTSKSHKPFSVTVLILSLWATAVTAQQGQPEPVTGLDSQARKLIESAGGVLTNVNQSSSSVDVILGNPKNVEAVNSLIGTNLTLGIEQIRAATMPTLATTPSARSLPLTLFETYANTAEKNPEQVARYVAIMDEVRDLLRSGNYLAAQEKILPMKDFDFDGGISENIRNRVAAAMQTKTEIQRIDREIEKHERDRRSSELLAGSQKTIPKAPTAGGAPTATGENSTAVNVTAPQVDPSQFSQMLENAYRATRREEDRLVAAAKIGAKELEKVKRDVESRQNFRSYIAALVTSQQYSQAILAIDFYRAIYNDGDYNNELAVMYNTALEANRQAGAELEAFKFKYQNNELAGASERLLAAFVTSRNLPGLLTVPRGEKRKVSGFLRDMAELESILIVKDYNTAEEKITAIRKGASDFDASKAMSLVNNGRMRSNFALGMARLSAQQGKVDEAQKYFYAAAELWPTNPDLKTASQSFFSTADTKEQYVTEFDRYWMEENWRALYDNRLKYAAALDGDKGRISKFEEALKKVEAVEIAILKAEQFQKAQNPAAAWEALEKASQVWSHDVKLNRMMAELAGPSSEFIAAIRNAKGYEEKGQWGAAATWYLQARNVNPMSALAEEGLQKAQEKILAENFRAKIF